MPLHLQSSKAVAESAVTCCMVHALSDETFMLTEADDVSAALGTFIADVSVYGATAPLLPTAPIIQQYSSKSFAALLQAQRLGTGDLSATILFCCVST